MRFNVIFGKTGSNSWRHRLIESIRKNKLFQAFKNKQKYSDMSINKEDKDEWDFKWPSLYIKGFYQLFK